MAIFKVTAVPDFSQLKGEIAKLQSSPVTLGVDTQQANVNINATRQSLQKLTETFSPDGELQRSVANYSSKIGEVVQVSKSLNAQSGAMEVTSKKVTQNFEAQAKAAQKAAAQVQAANDAYRAYAAQQSSTYAPTAMQSRIEDLTGVSGLSGKSAKESAAVFEKAFLDASGKVQQSSEKAAQKVKSVGTAAKESSGFAALMGDSFGRVAAKMALWQVLGNAIAGVKRSFTEALETMKAVDDEMVTIRKVTGATTGELNKIEKQAYETASAYGVAADEYLNSVANFSRAGYGEQASALAELATKTQIVGDTDAETAQQFLLSVDAAYSYKGSIEQLTKVLDGANEIDNNYATSIEKIAEGLGKVAPIASQAHVGVDELTAAIGTITAVTQRSGTEASTALRALFLNIIGDTKTEIDEGVTWTTGEIAGLRDVIKVYAKDAYDAAQATGEVINPMKAIAGLAQSMEDGLLTEQKLMEMVSDIGGKLRTSQLLALIQNWDMYESMLGDYANAVGSADKEVENALDSWTRKTEILHNKWTEFVSHLVETDTIKDALDGVIGLVELLDSDVGRFTLTVGALTTAVIALGIAKEKLDKTDTVKGIKAAMTAVKELTASVWEYVAAKKAADAAGESFSGNILGGVSDGSKTILTKLGKFAKTAGIIGGFFAAIKLAIKAQLKPTKELEEATDDVAEAQQALLDTDTEYDALISKTEELTDTEKERLKVLREIRKEQQATLEEAQHERWEKWNNIYGSGAKVVVGGAEGVGGGLGSGAVQTERMDIVALRNYTAEVKKLWGQLDDGTISEKEFLAALEESNAARKESVETIRDAVLAGETVTEEQQKLVDLYDELTRRAERIVNGQQALKAAFIECAKSGEISEEQYQTLIAMYPELADAATKTADGYKIQAEALASLMSAEQLQQTQITLTVKGLISEAQQAGKTGQALYDLVAAQITASDTKLDFSQQIAALRELAANAGYATSAYNNLLNAGRIWQEARVLTVNGKFKTLAEAQAYLTNKAWSSLTTTAPSGGWGSTTGDPGSDSSGTPSSNTPTSTQDDLNSARKKAAQATIDAIEKRRDAELEAIDEQIKALKKQNEETERGEKLEELKLEVMRKQDALLNARNERTVRMYNAETGQWEWIADPDKVKQAEEDLQDAKKELRDYEREMELDLAVEELEARKEAIEAAYQLKIDAWQDLVDRLNGYVETEAALLAASRGDWEAYYQEMLKVYQGLTEAAQSYTAQTQKTSGTSGTSGTNGSTEKVESPGNVDMSNVNSKEAYPDRPAAGTYNNMGISAATIKSMQKWYGVTSDGKWGQNSYDAAGYRTASEANEFWKNHYNRGGTEWGRASSYSELKSKYHIYDNGGVLHGLGGIKATADDEMVLPPDITKRLLSPTMDNRAMQVISDMRGVLLGSGERFGGSVAGTGDNRSYSDHSGPTYNVKGITLTEQQAEHLTVAQLCRMAHNVKPYGG